MNITILSRYEDLGASSRVRFSQYFGIFQELASDIKIRRQSLLSDQYLTAKYSGNPTRQLVLRDYFRRLKFLLTSSDTDLFWVEKEIWPFCFGELESRVFLRRPYALDLDDAIFHYYDLHPSPRVRRLWGGKIDQLMARAALVTAGNDYLADRAISAGARRVSVIPTVIDLVRYGVKSREKHPNDPLRIVWIGSPATVHFLEILREPLIHIAKHQSVQVVVIGAHGFRVPGIDVVSRQWAESSEAEEIAQCDIGVMPLPDSPWERGKCGYKLIQYMACGIPVVASPVGVNAKIVRDGYNGFLAADSAGWRNALDRLAADAELRHRFGRCGRQTVETSYSVQVIAPTLIEQLRIAAVHPTRNA